MDWTRSGRRSLTIAERAIAAVTASLAVATVALAIGGSARASTFGGALPSDGPYLSGPVQTISHAEATPAVPVPPGATAD